MSKLSMATQQQRSDTTKALLLNVFRACVIERGYSDTTLQTVLSATGLSKGAMYHHFVGKAEIMRALYTEESRKTFERSLAQVD